MKSRKATREGVATAIVPAGKKEIPIGTFRSIIKQSGLSLEDFT